MDNQNGVTPKMDIKTKSKSRLLRTGGMRKSIKRFNAIDAIVLVLVVALIGFIVYSVVTDGAPIKGLKRLLFGTSTATETVTVRFEVGCVDSENANQIRVGNIVYANGIKLGKITRVYNARPATEITESYTQDPESGKYYFTEAELEGKTAVTVEIEVTALREEDKGIFVEGARISAGATYELRFPQFISEGSCTTVNVQTEVTENE